MRSDSNPYQAPNQESQSNPNVPPVRRWITKLSIAAALFAAPFILALPIRYWVFHVAGRRFVSTDLEPHHRAAVLGSMYIPLMMSIAVFAMFPAFLLLSMDRCYPVLSAVATIVFGILLIPAILFITIGVQSYLQFG